MTNEKDISIEQVDVIFLIVKPDKTFFISERNAQQPDITQYPDGSRLFFTSVYELVVSATTRIEKLKEYIENFIENGCPKEGWGFVELFEL